MLSRLKAEIEKISRFIRLCHRVAAENVILQNTGKRPRDAGISGITPASLPEVGANVIELAPGDHHFIAIRRIDSNRRLVRSIAKDIVAIRIDVCLETGEHAELRNHAR